MNERIRMMSEDKIESVLLKLGIPAIIGMLIDAIYNFVDAIYVGGLGTSAMGAAAISFPILMIIVGLGLMMGSGAGSYISRLLGKGEYEQANKTASVAIAGSVVLWVLAVIPAIGFLEPLLKFFGATETILPFAKDYGYIFIGGSIFSVMNITMINIARAEGAAKMGMKALMLGAVLNIILDPIFIYSFALGIRGAAIATVISQLTTSIILYRFFFKGKSTIKLSLAHGLFNKDILLEIFKTGTPNLIFQLLTSAAIGLINSSAVMYGDAAVAAMGIVNRIFALGSYVVFGYSKGFQTIAGYSFGARRYKRLKEAIRISIKWATGFCLIVAITQILFAPYIVSIFSSDQEVLAIASKGLRAYSLIFPFFGLQIIYMTLFLALGKGKEGLILSISRQGIFLIPTILILPKLIGLNGVLYAQSIADFLTTILTLVMGIGLNKFLNRQISEHDAELDIA